MRTRLVKRYYGAGRDAWRMRLQRVTAPSGRGSESFASLPRWNERADPRRDALSSQWVRTRSAKETGHEEE